jgi:3-oxoacyl-[acyl-carrier protein] reductase
MSKKNVDPNAPVPRLTVDLAGQVALVTGASRGIGRSIAEALGRCGARVACVARNVEKLAETVQAIQAAGGSADAVPGDVTDGEAVQKLVDSIAEGWGRLDILVNNAGVTRDTLLPRMSDEQWDEVLNTNLRGTFLFTRAATRPMMQARYGRIINISSVSGLRGNPGQANYSASKAAVIGFTRTIARELASRKITVNVVAPGFIDTEMTAALGPVMLEEITKRMIPAKRMGQPDEIADAVLYFASPASGYVTGQVLVVDGGFAV